MKRRGGASASRPRAAPTTTPCGSVSNFTAGPAANVSTGEVNTGDQPNISFIGETEVLGKWHLRPNVSLRAGFQIIYVDSIALAPHQVNFVTPGYLPIADDGDIFCMGSSIGIEMYR